MIDSSSTLWFLKLIAGGLLLGLCLSCLADEPEIAPQQTTYDCAKIPEATISEQTRWTAGQLRTLCSMWLGSLPPLPPDPSNSLADNPQAVQLGKRLFFDKQLSADGSVACATCHDPTRYFTDGLSVAEGLGIGNRNTPTLIGIAYSPWFFWDGHKDSLWSQALEPLETDIEHGLSRTEVVAIILADEAYRAAYQNLVGLEPTEQDETELFVKLGKAIAAYERTLMPLPTRFDAYVADLLVEQGNPSTNPLTEVELAGLELFINKGQCINCHNSPLLTNHEFHNTAVSIVAEPARFEGGQKLIQDPFNCLGQYSDAAPEDCLELNFIKIDLNTSFGAFKTPTLRNVAQTAPYMHAGQLQTLTEVLHHYNQSPTSFRPQIFGHNELMPINLSPAEITQLEAFLRTLTSAE